MEDQSINEAIDRYILNDNKKPEFDSNDDDDTQIFKKIDYIDTPQKSYDVVNINTNNLETTKTLQNHQNYFYSISKTNTIIYEVEKKEDIKIEISQKITGKKRKRKKVRDKINKVNEIKKKNMGRISKSKAKERNNPSNKVHDKNSIDNSIYKIKVRYQKFLYEHLNHFLKKKQIKENFKRINGDLTRNGGREHNLNLFNTKIRDFLLCDISEKYGSIENSNNILIEKLNSDEDFRNLFNLTYNECLYKYFLMDKTTFKKMFQYENKFLYENIHLDIIEKNNWEKILEKGIIEHFKEISGRTTMTKEAKEERKSMNKKKNNKQDLKEKDLKK